MTCKFSLDRNFRTYNASTCINCYIVLDFMLAVKQSNNGINTDEWIWHKDETLFFLNYFFVLWIISQTSYVTLKKILKLNSNIIFEIFVQIIFSHINMMSVVHEWLACTCSWADYRLLGSVHWTNGQNAPSRCSLDPFQMRKDRREQMRTGRRRP